MSTEDPFITGMRTNLNAFNANAEQRLVMKARKAKRNRVITRVIIGAIGATLGITTGLIVTDLVDANAATQQQINRFIRSENGIAPCTHEDGSSQPGTCVWWAGKQGNGEGYSYLAVPDGRDANDDDDIIYITGPKAVRY